MTSNRKVIWHKICLFIAIAMSLAPYSLAQDIAGKWKGQITLRGRHQQKAYFEMNLAQDGQIISGASLVALNDTTTCTVLLRGTWDGNFLNYEETRIIKVRGAIDPEYWCMKKCTFTMTRQGGKEILTGNWTGKNSLEESCEPGMISVDRPLPLHYSEDSRHLESAFLLEINDVETKQPVKAKVEIVKANSHELVFKAGIEATYATALQVGEYEIFLSAKGYYQYVSLATIDDRGGETLQICSMRPIKLGDILPIDGLYFEQSEAVITRQSHRALDRIVEFLKENPTLHLRIAGHTDNIGNAHLNKVLSLSRAQSVANYFIGMGIAESRLEVTGQGGTQPLAPNDTAEGRAQNRRVTFEIIRLAE